MSPMVMHRVLWAPVQRGEKPRQTAGSQQIRRAGTSFFHENGATKAAEILGKGRRWRVPFFLL